VFVSMKFLQFRQVPTSECLETVVEVVCALSAILREVSYKYVVTMVLYTTVTNHDHDGHSNEDVQKLTPNVQLSSFNIV